VPAQFSPAFRSSQAGLRHAARLGIAFLPWSPLGGLALAEAEIARLSSA
jgi:aryl-alcohol dehydrogenase-like predicted oxidoreductase